MVDVFAGDSVLLVFAVIGVAAALGAVRIKGMSLGPAAALFVGLAVGAIDESLSSASGLGLLRAPPVLFTYTVGLASGPASSAACVGAAHGPPPSPVALIAGLAGLYTLPAAILDLPAADRAGLFAGSTTNTPALHAATEALTTGDPVVAYSLTYPAAVIAMLVVATLVLGRRSAAGQAGPAAPGAAGNGSSAGPSSSAPAGSLPWPSWATSTPTSGSPDRARRHSVGRRGGRRLQPGDAVVVVGPDAAVAAFSRDAGERSDHHVPLDRSVLDFRRIVVSNRRMAGRRLADLNIVRRHGVTVTRVRRGDDDLLAHDDLVLQLGDRVRVRDRADR